MIYAYPCEGVYGLGCDPDSKKDVFASGAHLDESGIREHFLLNIKYSF